MEFTDIGYSYLAPVLLLLLVLLKHEYKTYCRRFLIAANVCLLFFVISACREFYGLYLMAQNFGINVSLNGLLKLASTNIPFAAKNILALILPLCFLFKRLSDNLFLTICMVIIFWWDAANDIIAHQPIHLPGSNYSPIIFLSLRFVSLLVGMYSFLWLVNRYPKNSITNE